MDWLWTNIYFPIAFWKNRFGIWLGETSKFDSLHSLPVGLHMHGPFVCQQLRICFEICFRNLIWGLIEQILSPTNLHSLPTMDLHKEGLCVCQFFPSCILRHLICSFIGRRFKDLRTVTLPTTSGPSQTWNVCLRLLHFFDWILRNQDIGNLVERCWELLRVAESCWELLRAWLATTGPSQDFDCLFASISNCQNSVLPTIMCHISSYLVMSNHTWIRVDW